LFKNKQNFDQQKNTKGVEFFEDYNVKYCGSKIFLFVHIIISSLYAYFDILNLLIALPYLHCSFYAFTAILVMNELVLITNTLLYEPGDIVTGYVVSIYK